MRSSKGVRSVFSGPTTDNAGNVSTIVALMLFAIIGCCAIAVDISSFYYQKRRLQSATDMAAIAAAGNISNAQEAATATLALNGFSASTLQAIQYGIYTPDPTLSSQNRFVPSSQTMANAVRLTSQISAPMIFGRVLQVFQSTTSSGASSGSAIGSQPVSNSLAAAPTTPSVVVINAAAVGSQNNLASFAIGSGLVSLNGGVLNSVLGSLLGSNISLSVMDYHALASANIDLFSFSNALATRASMTAVTYNTLASGSFKTGDALGAVLDAANANPNVGSGAIGALSTLAAAVQKSSFNLAPIISYGPYGDKMVGTSPAISVTASALQLVTAILQIANGTHQIQAALNANIPGIASASLTLSIGERPVGTSFVAVGAAGASVHTAQTRLLLTVQLVAAGQSALVNLPVYIELASGTAQLSEITCASNDITSSSVTLSVTPAVVDGWIGNVSNAQLSNFTSKPNPGPAMLLNVVNVAQVTGLAHAAITNLSPTPVEFSYSDIQNVTIKTTSTTDFAGSLISSLVGGLQLNVNVAGIGLGLPTGLNQTVAQTVAAAASPLDQLITQVLQTLGLKLGNADTWVSGVKCGSAVLVR